MIPCNSFTFSAAKGITLLLLCRLGLATVVTHSGFQSAKWKTDFMPLSDAIISQKHAEVLHLLCSGGQYGGFDTVCFLARLPAANILAEKNYVCPWALPASVNIGSSSQHGSSSQGSIGSLMRHDDDSRIMPISHLNASKGRVYNR